MWTALSAGTDMLSFVRQMHSCNDIAVNGYYRYEIITKFISYNCSNFLIIHNDDIAVFIECNK